MPLTGRYGTKKIVGDLKVAYISGVHESKTFKKPLDDSEADRNKEVYYTYRAFEIEVIDQ